MKKIIDTFRCIGYSQAGKGLIDYKGHHVEVAGFIIDEVAQIVIKQKKEGYSGTLKKIIQASPSRVNAPCKYYEKCGGCQLQHLSTTAQNTFKQKYVAKQMKSFGKTNRIITMQSLEGYRNKSHHTFSIDQYGKFYSGLYRAETHRVVSIERCLIHDVTADRIANTITRAIVKLAIVPYNEDTGEGYLRHLLVRVGKVTKDVMVVLITSQKKVPHLQKLISTLIKTHPEITTIVQNINGKKTSVILGRTEIVHYGNGMIKDKLGGLTFNISPRSFYQINHVQTEKMYRYAIQVAGLKKTDVVIDAYSGIGTISLLAAQRVSKVIGIEINEAAVKDAMINAIENKIYNASFIYADAGEYISSENNNMAIDVLFLDPPRSGCSKTFIDHIKLALPSKIIYISCNPVTQARDLKQLKHFGYKIEKIQPFDMFPYTASVETVCLLTRK